MTFRPYVLYLEQVFTEIVAGSNTYLFGPFWRRIISQCQPRLQRIMTLKSCKCKVWVYVCSFAIAHIFAINLWLLQTVTLVLPSYESLREMCGRARGRNHKTKCLLNKFNLFLNQPCWRLHVCGALKQLFFFRRTCVLFDTASLAVFCPFLANGGCIGSYFRKSYQVRIEVSLLICFG